MYNIEIIEKNTIYLLNGWTIIPLVFFLLLIIFAIFSLLSMKHGEYIEAGQYACVVALCALQVVFYISINSITNYTVKIENPQTMEILELQYEIMKTIDSQTFVVREKSKNANVSKQKEYLPIGN